MDTKLKQLQEEYRQVPIPDELDFIVNKALKSGRKKRNSLKWLAGVSVAAMAFLFTINVSPSVANAFSTIPGIKGLIQVLTFTEYKIDDKTYNADVKVPIITNLDNKELELGLNEKYLAENKKLYEEFRIEMEALQQAGGGHLGLDSGFIVKTDNDQIFSIGRYVVNTVGSSSTIMKYDTIDKQNQILLSLPMLFKDDRYIRVISDNIQEQMRSEMEADPNKFYWVSNENNEDLFYEFESINKDQSFYISDMGQLVISFDKYEVAPGYMGIVEFVIPTEVISDLLVSDQYIK